MSKLDCELILELKVSKTVQIPLNLYFLTDRNLFYVNKLYAYSFWNSF